MNASTTSKVITWVTIVWVILVSYPKQLNAGPLAFMTCMTQTGPFCAGLAGTGMFFFYRIKLEILQIIFFIPFLSNCNLCCYSCFSSSMVCMHVRHHGSWMCRQPCCLYSSLFCTKSLNFIVNFS